MNRKTPMSKDDRQRWQVAREFERMWLDAIQQDAEETYHKALVEAREDRWSRETGACVPNPNEPAGEWPELPALGCSQ